MKIFHRVGINPDEQDVVDFAKAGIRLKAGYSVFEIEESDARWPKLKKLMDAKNKTTLTSTRFSMAEIDSATWLELQPTWHYGYPLPDDDFGFLSLTYDSNAVNYCLKCRMGKIQNSPFRIKGEPKWGRNHILQLNWVFDEYFVRNDVYDSVFKPLGIGCLPVLKYKSENELQTIVQLQIAKTADSNLKIEGYSYEVCSVCNRKRYLPITRGYFPTFSNLQKETYIMKSREEFGSGARSSHAVIVSNKLYRVIVENKLKGVSFYPLGPTKGDGS